MATINDVARACGVSPTTVSFVLNNGPRPVSARTRERVQEAMLRLNYHPSAVARGLARQRMHTIGVLFSGHNPRIVHNGYAVALLDGIVAAATTHGYNVTLITRHWNASEEPAPVICDGRSDGILILSPLAGADAALGTSAHGTPLVQIGAPSVLPGIPWVDIDNHLGASLAARHLIQLGHRKIALLMGDSDYEHVAVRRSTFLAELAASGIDVPPRFRIESSDYNDMSARGRAIASLLSRADRPTAVLASSDPLAIDAMREARALGLRVPEELSITGFDDSPSFGYDGPKLTTVHQPLFEMGQAAADRLIGQIEKQGDLESTVLASPIVFTPELIVRESTSAVPTDYPTFLT